jgi:hypothetical protein
MPAITQRRKMSEAAGFGQAEEQKAAKRAFVANRPAKKCTLLYTAVMLVWQK